ncbi:pullulanase, partial [Globicatella sanguinis]|uniref:pullulanase n=1 Tax=Globicatella sanguinis TaxID=13076 RepID=UPI0012ED558B
REDAIIYEAHVRDFTSDPNIADELTAQFGTFAAFVERLDYLQDLGVTHIQLLPVMNYYNVNELINDERLLEYASSNSNYNWGYDPQNYFALTGMYSEDPTNPSKRIEEFKNLVNEIHKRGMGVILDVVYNHTAQVHIFEDLEPNYYHFMKADGTPKESFGGGRLGTTHKMARRVLVDSIKYLVDEYKVDGFRFDMMGDHDAASIEEAYNAAKALNPNILMLGEGWVTYEGDDGLPEQPADQTWMQLTDSVASFSDEIRNELKSGFGSEGQPRFLTNGARNLELIFNNIIGRPSNFKADDPGDVIQYIAAHDNLTLFDVIAQSIKKDPKYHSDEILRRVRLGNSIILTSQGTPFIHSGQEYGRTKQYLDPAYRTTVSDDLIPNKATYMVDADGNPFEYPYFIHDSYDSSDAINRFDWEKATNAEKYAENVLTHNYTRGLISIRRSTDAFSHDLASEIDQYVSLITVPNTNPNARVEANDLIIGYQAKASNGDIYAVFVNADDKARTVNFGEAFKHLGDAKVIADAKQAGTRVIETPEGVVLDKNSITLDGLTTAILLIKKGEEIPATEITPVPEISEVKDGEVVQGHEVTLDDYSALITLPEDAYVSEIVEGINTSNIGKHLAKVKVVFKDGSSRIVSITMFVFPSETPIEDPEEGPG